LSRKPLVAPATKPIADAARYKTPNTFSRTGVHDEREQRVRHTDDPELHELDRHGCVF